MSEFVLHPISTCWYCDQARKARLADGFEPHPHVPHPKIVSIQLEDKPMTGKDVFKPLTNEDFGLSSNRADGGGLRYNEGKIKVELLPPEWIMGLAIVMTRGAMIYAERNWERGMAWSIMVGCAFRHLLKFLMGQRHDEETGCHHLAMAAWNLLALMVYDVRRVGTCDLPGITMYPERIGDVPLAKEPNEKFKQRVADAAKRASGQSAS